MMILSPRIEPHTNFTGQMKGFSGGGCASVCTAKPAATVMTTNVRMARVHRFHVVSFSVSRKDLYDT
jgi:hypothetical protein